MERKSAIISTCKRYRYQLERGTTARSAKRSTVSFIGLNPSTADAYVNDPTIRRCIGFALHWQFKTLIMVNLFAWRSTDPSQLYETDNPIGAKNDHYLEEALSRSSLVIACWGEHGTLHGRAASIRAKHHRRLQALKINKSGQPAHPLYLPATSKPTKLAKSTSKPSKS